MKEVRPVWPARSPSPPAGAMQLEAEQRCAPERRDPELEARPQLEVLEPGEAERARRSGRWRAAAVERHPTSPRGTTPRAIQRSGARCSAAACRSSSGVSARMRSSSSSMQLRTVEKGGELRQPIGAFVELLELLGVGGEQTVARPRQLVARGLGGAECVEMVPNALLELLQRHSWSRGGDHRKGRVGLGRQHEGADVLGQLSFMDEISVEQARAATGQGRGEQLGGVPARRTVPGDAEGEIEARQLDRVADLLAHRAGERRRRR